MNALMVSLSDDELKLIANELEKLHVLQDKPMNKEKKAIFIQEISRWELPFKSIVAGIRSLQADDLKTIKIGLIHHAALKFTEFEKKDNTCRDCVGDGLVLMRDEEHRIFCLSCNCPAGIQANSVHRIAQWSGNSSQTSNSRLLTHMVRG